MPILHLNCTHTLWTSHTNLALMNQVSCTVQALTFDSKIVIHIFFVISNLNTCNSFGQIHLSFGSNHNSSFHVLSILNIENILRFYGKMPYKHKKARRFFLVSGSILQKWHSLIIN